MKINYWSFGQLFCVKLSVYIVDSLPVSATTYQLLPDPSFFEQGFSLWVYSLTSRGSRIYALDLEVCSVNVYCLALLCFHLRFKIVSW